MAEIKATEEIFRAIGASREKVIDNIKTGLKKGRIDEKTIWLDESEVPEAFRPKNPNAPPEPVSTKDLIVAETERLKAEASKLKAETELAIVRGEHDKPEVLAQKETSLNQREVELNERSKSLDNREIVVQAKELTLKSREAQIVLVEKSLVEKAQTFAQECQKKLDDIDVSALAQQQELEHIDKQINSKKVVLDGLMKVISEYPEAVKPFINELDKLTKIANVNATRNYQFAQKTSGKTSEYYTHRTKNFWNLESAFKKLRKTLGV